MQTPASARLARDHDTITHAFTSADVVLLQGPPGIGKTHAIRSYGELFGSRFVSAHTVTADTHELPPLTLASLLLIPDLDRLPQHTRELIHNAPPGTRILASVSPLSEHPVKTPTAPNTSTLEALRLRFTRTLTLTYEPHTDTEIESLLHAHSALPLDVRTVARLIELSWGRPGWAFRFLRAINEFPELRARIHKPVLDPTLARFFTDLWKKPAHASDAARDLSDSAIADAIVLAEIGPRSYGGVIDLIGFTHTHQLERAHLLERAPGDQDRWGIPLIHTPVLLAAAAPKALADSYRRIVVTLLDHQQLGLPLTAREERVSAFALLNSGAFANTPTPSHPHEQHLLTRRMRRLLCFGQAEPAKDAMLRLGRSGTELCQLTKARLITLLQNEHAGLQALLFTTELANNCSLPLVDDDHRLGLLFLRAQLASETGTNYLADDEALNGDAHWDATFQLLQAWNQREPLTTHLSQLRHTAQHHPRAEIRLLAELLCEIDAASLGAPTPNHDAQGFAQRLTAAFREYEQHAETRSKLDDVYVTLVVTYHLIGLFAPAETAHLELTAQLVQRLAGDREHLVWIAHLNAAKAALHCGDIVRTELELQRLAATLPVFLPIRLRAYLDEFIRACADGQARIGQRFASQLVSYFAGEHEGFALLPPASATASADTIANGSVLTTIATHRAAAHARNPAALRRVAQRLQQLSLWGPAQQALQDALAIYTGRRASGKCAEIEHELTLLQREVRSRVLWLTPLPAEKPLTLLSPREAETARQVALGRSNLEIAAALRRSVRTVESHVSSARSKLGARNRAELAERINLSEATHGGSTATLRS